MKIDLYTKTILTIIAIGLWAMLLSPIVVSDKVSASTAILDVNIKEIGGRRINNAVLQVDIKKINGRSYFGSSVPVSIKK